MDTIVSKIPSLHDFTKGLSTIEIGYPWLTFGAIMALEQIVKPDFKVLELGCGGSTIWFDRHCAEVKAFETDAKWIMEVKVALGDTWVTRIECVDPEALVEIARKEPNDYYDLVLVDTGAWKRPRYDGTIKKVHPNRRALSEAVLSKIKKGGYFAVDNYERFGMGIFDYSGLDVYTFDQFGFSGRGTKICIKEKQPTDILEYHSFSEVPKGERFNRTYAQFKKDIKTPFDIITMDDGYESQIKACEILDQSGIQAVLSITPAYIGKNGYMSWDQVRELSKRHWISNHTLTHRKIVNRSNVGLTREIADANMIIEQETGVKCSYFTPPYNYIRHDQITFIERTFGLHVLLNRKSILEDTILEA
jgi:hypothetical protein